MSRQVYYNTVQGPDLTESIIAEAAALFSKHYGHWSSSTSTSTSASTNKAPNSPPPPPPQQPAKGQRVRMSPSFLRKTCLPHSGKPQLTCAIDPRTKSSIGHIVTNHWPVDPSDPESDTVCWITQLVVHSSWRRRGIATALLRRVKKEIEQRRYHQPVNQPANPPANQPRDLQRANRAAESYPGDVIFGVLSSHPATIRVFCTVFGRGIKAVDLADTRDLATRVVKGSPVRFVRECKVRGSLFSDGGGDDDDDGSGGGEGDHGAKTASTGEGGGRHSHRGSRDGGGGGGDERDHEIDAVSIANHVVCCADTGFFVDSSEARREVLGELRSEGVKWPFGDLPPGHEYLVLFRDQVKVFI